VARAIECLQRELLKDAKDLRKKAIGTFRKATAKGNGAHEVGMGARNEFADLLSAFDESLREGSVQRSGFDRRAPADLIVRVHEAKACLPIS